VGAVLQKLSPLFDKLCAADGAPAYTTLNFRGETRRNATHQSTTAKASYRVSQSIRLRVEEIFGWTGVVGGLKSAPDQVWLEQTNASISSGLK